MRACVCAHAHACVHERASMVQNFRARWQACGQACRQACRHAGRHADTMTDRCDRVQSAAIGQGGSAQVCMYGRAARRACARACEHEPPATGPQADLNRSGTTSTRSEHVTGTRMLPRPLMPAHVLMRNPYRSIEIGLWAVPKMHVCACMSTLAQARLAVC